MASIPPAGSLSSILQSQDTIINQQHGVAAGIDGQQYFVQRLTAPSPAVGSLSSQPSPRGLSNYYMRPGLGRKMKMENVKFDLLVYEGICDANTIPLVDQDVLTQFGFKNDGSVFTFVQNRPTQPKLFIRTEAAVTITRPWPPAGRPDQQPVSGNVPVPGWGGITKKGEITLSLGSLVPGMYSFDDQSAPPASVYCGLQPLSRIKDTSASSAAGQMPTALYREQFAIYIPNLPGVMIQELDRVNFQNSDRFEIMLFHNTNETGITGYVCLCEKLGT